MTQATSQPLLCNAASNGEPDGYHHLLEQFCHHTLQQHPIYRNNQLAGHIQALVTNYPLTHHLCGEELFYPLAQQYIIHHDRQHQHQHRHQHQQRWDINQFGNGFCDWLAQQQFGPKANEKDWLLLADIAKVEYHILGFYYQITPTYQANNTVLPFRLAHADQIFPGLKHFHPQLTFPVQAQTQVQIQTQTNAKDEFVMTCETNCDQSSGFTIQIHHNRAGWGHS